MTQGHHQYTNDTQLYISLPFPVGETVTTLTQQNGEELGEDKQAKIKVQDFSLSPRLCGDCPGSKTC